MKTAKTRNPERRSGKAWGKSHNDPAKKKLTAEQEARKMHKDAERKKRRPAQSERGFSLTMPQLTWEWCADSMNGRMANTRRYRTMDAVFNQERRGTAPSREA